MLRVLKPVSGLVVKKSFYDSMNDKLFIFAVMKKTSRVRPIILWKILKRSFRYYGILRKIYNVNVDNAMKGAFYSIRLYAHQYKYAHIPLRKLPKYLDDIKLWKKLPK